jgi:hypothetical protein
MSHSPLTTRAELPLEEPPAERFGSWGFRTGPVSEVWLPPEKQRCSHTALPAISPPASRMRVTIVASTSGTKPSSTFEPFIMGIPATQTLSLIAIFLPASFPPAAPLIKHFQYHALSRFSLAAGRRPASRGYFTGRVGSTNWSRRR